MQGIMESFSASSLQVTLEVLCFGREDACAT